MILCFNVCIWIFSNINTISVEIQHSNILIESNHFPKTNKIVPRIHYNVKYIFIRESLKYKSLWSVTCVLLECGIHQEMRTGVVGCDCLPSSATYLHHDGGYVPQTHGRIKPKSFITQASWTHKYRTCITICLVIKLLSRNAQ